MTVREVLRAVAWRLAPGAMADRARDYESGLRARVGLTALAETFAREHGDRVLRGPVAGLRLVLPRVGEIDAPVAKLLGTYEEEIHPALQRAIDAGPARFIDIGSADGYFAVGIAVAAKVPVDAFDLSSTARSMTRETAALNGVERCVTIHGAASAPVIERLELSNSVLLCDIDGPERNLFSPGLIVKLASAHVIVEMHSAAHPDVEPVLLDRFERTHDVHVVEAARRDPSRYPELSVFEDEDDRDHAVNELRYRFDGLRWLIAEPRAGEEAP
jgi:hypothetical protein